MAKKSNKPVVYSALEVANICGVVNQTAINWIRSNYLKAFKTPGGQFRVYPDDLAEFMESRDMRIPEELLANCTKQGNRAKKSILIVDDDESLNTVMAKFIGKKFENLEVFQAFDGFDAGSQMTEKKPEYVILDLDLPGVDGFDLCRRINESETFGNSNSNGDLAIEQTSLASSFSGMSSEADVSPVQTTSFDELFGATTDDIDSPIESESGAVSSQTLEDDPFGIAPWRRR